MIKLLSFAANAGLGPLIFLSFGPVGSSCHLAFKKSMNPEIALNSNSHGKKIIQTLSDLYRNNILTDLTFVCDDRYRIEAHRLVLCASSPLLRDFITINTQSHPLIYLKGVKGHSLSTIMQFLYTGEVSIKQEELPSLMELAKELKIEELQEQQDIQNHEGLRQENDMKDEEDTSPEVSPPSPKDKSMTLNATETNKGLDNVFQCGDCEYRGKSHKQLLDHGEKLHAVNVEESSSRTDELNYDQSQEALDAVGVLEITNQGTVTDFENLFAENYGIKSDQGQKSVRIIESKVHNEFFESSKHIVVKNKRKTIWRSECKRCPRVIDNKKTSALKRHLASKHHEVYAQVQSADDKSKEQRMEKMAKDDGLKPILDGFKIELAFVQSQIKKELAKGDESSNLTELFYKEAELKSKIHEF